MYNNHYSKNKQKCRDLIAKQVSKFKGDVNVFTLPSTNFILEENLSKKSNVSLYCAENNPYIYKQQRKHLISKQVFLKKGDVFDVLNKSKEQFDVIWLDLCCTIRHDVLNRIIDLVQSNKLKTNSYLNITISVARETHYENMLRFYGAKSLDDFRNKVFPNLVIQFSESTGKKCKLLSTMNYKEKGHSIPMKMLTFKIN